MKPHDDAGPMGPHVAVALAATAALLLHAAHYRSHWADDAFITFRYARNLAAGQGLVYNAGERLEGITNLGWAALLSPFAEGDALGAARAMGLACGIATIGLLAAWARRQGLSWGASALGLAALVGAPWVPAWTMLGLETPAVMLGVTLSWSRAGADRRWPLCGIAMALTPWIRPDAALIPALIGAWHVLSRRSLARPVAAGLVIVSAIALVGVKLVWFGEVLPHTFHVKVTEWPPWRGSVYLRSLFDSPLLPGLLALGVVRGLLRPRDDRGLPALVVIAWVGAMVALNGDFMANFRLFVPAWPAACAAFAALAHEAIRRQPGALATAGVLMAFALAPQVRIGLVDSLDRPGAIHQGDRARKAAVLPWNTASWDDGLAEHAGFAAAWPLVHVGPEGVVAYSDIGVFGFVNDLRVVDLLGLTDRVLGSEPDPAVRRRYLHEQVDWLLVEMGSSVWSRWRGSLAEEGWSVVDGCGSTWVLANPRRVVAPPDAAERARRLDAVLRRMPDAHYLGEAVARELARVAPVEEVAAWTARVDGAFQLDAGLCGSGLSRLDVAAWADPESWPGTPESALVDAPVAVATPPFDATGCDDARKASRAAWEALRAASEDGGVRRLYNRAAARSRAGPDEAVAAAREAVAATSGDEAVAARQALALTEAAAAACGP